MKTIDMNYMMLHEFVSVLQHVNGNFDFALSLTSDTDDFAFDIYFDGGNNDRMLVKCTDSIYTNIGDLKPLLTDLFNTYIFVDKIDYSVLPKHRSVFNYIEKPCLFYGICFQVEGTSLEKYFIQPEKDEFFEYDFQVDFVGNLEQGKINIRDDAADDDWTEEEDDDWGGDWD